MTADDEAGLLAACQANPRAFRPLYERYLPRVYRYLLFRVGEASTAEDLTSQVFLAALEGLPGYRHKGYFAAWLFAIARRKLADHFRRPAHQPLPEDLLAQGAGLLEQVARWQDLDCLAQRVAGLQEDEQELLRLRFAAELSFAEIAAMQRRTPAAVKMALYRLLRRLAAEIGTEE